MAAIGNTSGLSLPLQRALMPGSDLDPVPAPHPGDWLSVQMERGQSFDEYVNANPGLPERTQKVLYLAPMGEFPEGSSPSMDLLKACAESFFMMDVNVSPPVRDNHLRFTTRTNPVTNNLQMLTTDVLAHLKKHFPPDAFSVLGITMQDLYPGDDWNFVFGQASPDHRVGVFSFARYDPAFYGHQKDSDSITLLNARSLKVLVHETCHMFSLDHCTYFHCLMNGSNHLAESDARPMHLCPVCLRKLHHAIGFDVVQHYQKLFYFFRTSGFDKEARWISRRLENILGS